MQRTAISKVQAEKKKRFWMQIIKCSVSSLSFTHTSFTTEISSFSYGLSRVNIAWIYYSLLFPLTRCPTKSGNCLIKFLSEMLNCASWQQSSPTSLHVPSAWHFPFSLFTCGGYGTKYTTGHTMNSCSNSTNKSNMCCWAFGFQVLETQLMFLHFVTAASFSFQLLQCPSGYKNTDIRDVQNYYRPS